MDTYIKTIINGLKAWVTNCLSRLESSVSGNLASMADKLTSLSSKVQKNTTDIAQLQAYEDETNALANQAQSTATQAQSTATQAQSTANQAQSTANQAQTTANQAQSTANQAQTTATNAQTIANSAHSTANSALPRAGGNITGAITMGGGTVISDTGELHSIANLWVNSTPGVFGTFRINRLRNSATVFYVDRDSETDASAPSTIRFVANGSASMNLEGINVIQMKSPSGKKFNITVSDDGTLTTTEATT